MTAQQVKDKVAELLLPELLEGVRSWYYISVANEKFIGGYFIQAFGPIDANTLLHRLGWYPYGTKAETEVMGPVSDDKMETVPEDFRWRKLSKEEVKSLG